MKTTLRWSAPCALLLGGWLIGGCGDDSGDDAGGGIPIDAQEATLTVNTNVRGSLVNASRAIQFLNDSSVLEGLGFGGVVLACDEDPSIPCTPDPEADLRYDFEDSAGETADWLAEHIFADEYVESERGNSVVYLIPASLICDSIFGIEDDPNAEPAEGAEPSCEEVFTQVPIRVRVTSPREGDIDAELLVGDDRFNPIDVRAYQNELGGQLDLGATKDAVEAILEAAAVEDVQLPAVMRGTVGAALVLLGTDHARLTASVLSDVEVSSSTDDASFSFGLAASNPAASLEVDGVARVLTAALDLGALDFGFDTNVFGVAQTCTGGLYDEPVCETAPAHRIAFHLGGASGSLALAGETDSITVENVGIGDDSTVLRLDGQDLLRVDLNSASGRRLDVTAQAVDGDAEVSVAPALALAVVLSFANDISGYLDMPDWADNDTITVDLNGDAAPAVRSRELSDGSRVIEVVRGTLRVASSFLGLDATAAAGECAWQTDATETDPYDLEEDPHPLEGLLSGTCPE